MVRAIIEICITILVAYVARAILTSVLRSIANASAQAFQQSRTAHRSTAAPDVNPTPPHGSELHKDPVCGTYVAESTPFRRRVNGTIIYYCSDACRQKHAA